MTNQLTIIHVLLTNYLVWSDSNRRKRICGVSTCYMLLGKTDVSFQKKMPTTYELFAISESVDMVNSNIRNKL